MEVREAVEADAGRMAELTEAPADVMRNLVHDRTVRIAIEDEEVLGFVSFDARRDTVHVTQFEGTREAGERLLEEPVRFARNEGMNVELLVPEDEETLREAAESAAFTLEGQGPTFDGVSTIRYRLEADEK